MDNKLGDFFRLSFGNILEWYDFSLYMYFIEMIRQHFFPLNNVYFSTLATLATFAAGSIVRPVGGVLAGWLSDLYSPRKIVNICVIAMGITTFLIALLPDYSMIGWVAPMLLVTLRLIQGLSVGGQMPGLITLSANEHTQQRGFAVSLIFTVSSLGFLLASFVGWAMSYWQGVIPDTIRWRLPFALSGVLFMIYLYLNRGQQRLIPAKPSDKSSKKIVSALLKQWPAIMAVVALTTMCASLYYLTFTYLMAYQVAYLGVAKQTAAWLNMMALALACVLYPIAGKFVDRFGSLWVFILTAGSLFVLAIPLIAMLKLSISLISLIVLFIMTIIMAFMQATVSPLFAMAFEQEWRTTGCAFSYGVGNGLAGSAPLVAALILHWLPHWGLAFLIMGLILLGIVGMVLIYKKSTELKNKPTIVV